MKKPKCCGKEMHESPVQDMLSDTEGTTWTCLVCGTWHSETSGQLDEEELENYKENYAEQPIKEQLEDIKDIEAKE